MSTHELDTCWRVSSARMRAYRQRWQVYAPMMAQRACETHSRLLRRTSFPMIQSQRNVAMHQNVTRVRFHLWNQALTTRTWSSGVHLRYHAKDEYSALTKEQKQELREWRMTNPNPKAGGASEKKPSGSSTGQLKRLTKRQLSSAVAKELKKLANSEEQGPMTNEAVDISSLVKEAVASHFNQVNSEAKSTTLRAILRNAMN